MSDIPYVNQLGDAIEAAIARNQESAPRWRQPRVGLLRGRRGLSVVLATLAIGGGAAALAHTLQNSTALVAGGIACYAGAGTGASAYYNVEADGRSPQAACVRVFRTDGPAALARPGVKFVTCADPHGYVAVFRASGAAAQCRSEGMSRLQTGSYAVAQARVDRLVQALARIGASRPCIPPATLVGEVQGALDHRGWSGWHARLHHNPGGGGCGLFEGTGSSFSDPTASLDAAHHVVWIVPGPIPSLIRLTGPIDLKLLRASGRHCFTPASARALVRETLGSADATIRFALTQEPAGEEVAYAQHAYDRGCTIVGTVTAAPYGRTINAWLNSKSAPPETRGAAPSPGQFHPHTAHEARRAPT
jgi:hypothetical protein